MGAKSKKEKKVEETPVEDVEEESTESVEEVPVKKTKAKKSPAKKESKVKEPKERKPRAPRQPVTVLTYNEELDSIVSSLEEEVEKRAKSGEAGSRMLKGVVTRLKALRKKTVKITKVKRNRAEGTTGGFDKKKVITDEFCDFLDLPHGSELSNREAFMAICVYVNMKEGEDRESALRWKHLQDKKHGGPRCLQNKDEHKGSEIIPDEKLRKLLRYDQYVEDVKAGKVTVQRKSKETGEKETVVIEDDCLRYCTLQKLIGNLWK